MPPLEKKRYKSNNWIWVTRATSITGMAFGLASEKDCYQVPERFLGSRLGDFDDCQGKAWVDGQCCFLYSFQPADPYRLDQLVTPSERSCVRKGSCDLSETFLNWRSRMDCDLVYRGHCGSHWIALEVRKEQSERDACRRIVRRYACSGERLKKYG